MKEKVKGLRIRSQNCMKKPFSWTNRTALRWGNDIVSSQSRSPSALHLVRLLHLPPPLLLRFLQKEIGEKTKTKLMCLKGNSLAPEVVAETDRPIGPVRKRKGRKVISDTQNLNQSWILKQSSFIWVLIQYRRKNKIQKITYQYCIPAKQRSEWRGPLTIRFGSTLWETVERQGAGPLFWITGREVVWKRDQALPLVMGVYCSVRCFWVDCSSRRLWWKSWNPWKILLEACNACSVRWARSMISISESLWAGWELLEESSEMPLCW